NWEVKGHGRVSARLCVDSSSALHCSSTLPAVSSSSASSSSFSAVAVETVAMAPNASKRCRCS
ncbi:hypothetical protein Q8A73_016592, partial [Channa argus]